MPREPLIIGLTGRRGVGKSTVADFLVHRGFIRVHPFDGGKKACYQYFIHAGASHKEAMSMIGGEMKDRPSRILPGNATARSFMEKFGYFLGVEMGVEWTLGVEIDRVRRLYPGAPVVVESVVYEADYFRSLGGKIIRIVRPGHASPAGEKTDQAEALIEADGTIVNDSHIDLLGKKALNEITPLMATP